MRSGLICSLAVVARCVAGGDVRGVSRVAASLRNITWRIPFQFNNKSHCTEIPGDVELYGFTRAWIASMRLVGKAVLCLWQVGLRDFSLICFRVRVGVVKHT